MDLYREFRILCRVCSVRNTTYGMFPEKIANRKEEKKPKTKKTIDQKSTVVFFPASEICRAGQERRRRWHRHLGHGQKKKKNNNNNKGERKQMRESF